MNKDLTKLNKRQDAVLNFLEKKGNFSISQILEKIKVDFGEISKITLNRDLTKLIELNLIISKGKARGISYELSPHFNLIKPVNVEKYFKTEVDKRKSKERFDFDIFSILKNIFTKNEKIFLSNLKKEYQENRKRISENLYKKEMERLVIELSWKSSQIEGNTYSLLETESLIKEHKEAKGHKKEEAVMILNHKKTVDYIEENKKRFAKFSTSKIEQIHSLLVNNLKIARNIRKSAVGITGTKYRPLDNEWQIKEALEKICKLINQEKDSFAKALILSLMIAYAQPFEDGNKRTSRLVGNAVLLADNICPLSYRNVDETEYKKAVILFYEQNNLNYFKQLFIEQFEFAVKNYFRA